MSPVVVDAAAVRAALPFERLVPALRALLRDGCTVPERHVHRWPDGAGGEVTTLIMPAWGTAGLAVVKMIQIAPGNAARGLPGLHASVLVMDAATGVPLAVLDGNELTARRTAATAALAADVLVGPGPQRLLVVGAGRIAALLPAAHAAVRPLAEVVVWARRREAALALSETWRAQGVAARVADDLAKATACADIVACATLASAPVVQGAWLKPGGLLTLIGSFAPDMREADDAVFADADLYLDTEEALRKSGDLLGPIARGVFAEADVRATLAQLCRGEREAAPAGQRRAVFKSVGHGSQDLCAASLVMAAQGLAR